MVKHLRFFLITLSVLILDQATKFFIRSYIESELAVTAFFSIVYVKNRGAGFGILQGHTSLLIVISLLAVLLIVYYYLKTDQVLPLALILGGALGNLTDRIFLGHVVDFLSLSFWPAFNIADTALTVGAFLIIYVSFKTGSDKAKDSTDKSQ